MLQPQSRGALLEAVTQYGVAPGANAAMHTRLCTKCLLGLRLHPACASCSLDPNHYPSPAGARKMMDSEEEAAAQAIATGKPPL